MKKGDRGRKKMIEIVETAPTMARDVWMGVQQRRSQGGGAFSSPSQTEEREMGGEKEKRKRMRERERIQ